MKAFLIIAVLLLAAMLIVASCKKDNTIVGAVPEEFLVKADSVKLQKNPNPVDGLKAQLWGTIGASTCYSFSRYETSRDSVQVRVKIFGYYTASNNCTPSTIRLNGALYLIPAPFYHGTFTIIVQQPDGSTLRDTTTII